jgi:hypothetical protein
MGKHADSFEGLYTDAHIEETILRLQARTIEEMNAIPQFEADPVSGEERPNQELNAQMDQLRRLANDTFGYEKSQLLRQIMMEREALINAWAEFAPVWDAHAVEMSVEQETASTVVDEAPDPDDIDTYKTGGGGSWVVYSDSNKRHFAANKDRPIVTAKMIAARDHERHNSTLDIAYRDLGPDSVTGLHDYPWEHEDGTDWLLEFRADMSEHPVYAPGVSFCEFLRNNHGYMERVDRLRIADDLQDHHGRTLPRWRGGTSRADEGHLQRTH